MIKAKVILCPLGRKHAHGDRDAYLIKMPAWLRENKHKGVEKMIDTYRHEGHTVYRLTKRLTLFKQHKKMLFWHKGKIIPNHRFGIYPNKELKYFKWFIRLPYFYFERGNGFLYIGTPNLYLSRKRKRI